MASPARALGDARAQRAARAGRRLQRRRRPHGDARAPPPGRPAAQVGRRALGALRHPQRDSQRRPGRRRPCQTQELARGQEPRQRVALQAILERRQILRRCLVNTTAFTSHQPLSI